MDCPLDLGDRAVGTLRWRRAGNTLALDASCPMEPGYIYRVEVGFPDGPRTLGVMLPSDGRFRLKKTLVCADEPLSARILRALPGERPAPPLPCAFSRLTERVTAALVRDELFLRCAPAHVLAAEEGKTRWLALPFEEQAASPCAPFFCVASLLEREERTLLVFCADAAGALCPPPREKA